MNKINNVFGSLRPEPIQGDPILKARRKAFKEEEKARKQEPSFIAKRAAAKTARKARKKNRQ